MVLVTGATGLVGTHLVAELIKRGIRVRATRRAGSDTGRVYQLLEHYSVSMEQYSELLDWVELDLLNPVDAYGAISGTEVVYHTAAMISFDPRDRKEILKNNVQITGNIVNACLDQNIKKLCYTSSTSALGSALMNEKATEGSPWIADESRTSYSLSKYRSEMEVWRGIAEGLNAVIVNPSIIVGPGDWIRGSSRMFKVVWDGLKYYTEGVTGYVDVRDVVNAMIWLAESEISGERYIISSENLSYREVFTLVAHELGRKPPEKLATPFLLGITYRIDWLRSILFRSKRILTREAIMAGQQKKYYSNKKITDAMGIQFIPVARSVKDTASVFLSFQ